MLKIKSPTIMPDTEKIQDKATKDVSRDINKIIQDTVRDVSDDLNTVQNMVLGIDTTVTTAYATNLLTTANAYADSNIVNAITTANSHTDIHVLIITTSIVNAITTSNAYTNTIVALGITTSNAYADAIGIDDLLPAQSGKSGQYLTTNATSSSWAAISGSNFSNVLFCYLGVTDAVANSAGEYVGASLLPTYTDVDSNRFLGTALSTYQAVLTGRFTKIAGISTVTIHAKLWSDNNGADREAILSVDIGGQSNTVKSVTSTTPTWVTTSTIDVSSLTNGTTYDITVQMKSEYGGSTLACCGGLILTGS